LGKSHVVQAGECVGSIAFEHGFFPRTVWDHPDNAELKARRKDPNVLLAGDLVQVPDLRPKEVSVAAGASHTFVRRGVPERFRLQLRRRGKPRADLRFELRVGVKVIEGRTDAGGNLETWIPPDAKEGELLLIDSGERFRLALGKLDPVEEISGVQHRLFNLGLYTGPLDGQPGGALTAAVEAFQVRCGLPETGELDATTRQKLKEAHGG